MVIDSGIRVLREGLETIRVLAVLTASMRGANTAPPRRKPATRPSAPPERPVPPARAPGLQA